MKLHLLTGFLGSGKTTAIQEACSELTRSGNRVAVITNDQGRRLVDGDFFEHLNIPNKQVINACFCCSFNDLDSNIQSLIKTNQPDVIFAESVGSCTDIVATVMKPLFRYRPEIQVTFSTIADIRLLEILMKKDSHIFDESVRYIYFKQLEEAEIIVVSKIDLIDKKSLEEIKQRIDKKYGNKILLYQNSFDPKNIRQWLHQLDNQLVEKPLSLQIDYDVYGEGEAKLAWHDQELEIHSTNYNATKAAIDLMKLISQKIYLNKYPIGHLKFLLNRETKISFTYASNRELMPAIKMKKNNSATLLINARVQTTPGALAQIMVKAINEIEIKCNCRIGIKSIDSFQPSFPKPTYHITD